MHKMFAKLKKKIEEEAQADLSKSHSSATPSPYNPRRAAGNSRQTSPNRVNSFDRERRMSVSSTDSKDSCRLSTAEVPDEISDLLRTKTDQVHKLETRLQEYYHALQEQLDGKAKLEAVVEKNKLLLTSTIEKKEHEFSTKLAALEKEKDQLIKKLESAKLLQNSYIEKQDVIDELEGFQTQEMAKIKHMLLNCQQELQIRETSEKTLQTELVVSNALVAKLELEVKQVNEKLEKEENERRKLTDTETNSTFVIKDLEESKLALTERTTKLSKELEEVTSKCNRFEQMLAELRDENDALSHSHELYSASTTKQIEEKDANVSHLEERIAILEQRVSDSNLSGDDQFQAFLTERDSMEKKLDESRHHLMEIKSTWSEKIMNLEKQIAHLNKKIAEDSQEIQRLEETARTTQASTVKQISDLNEQLSNSKASCDAIKQMHKERETVWDNVKSMLRHELESLQLAKEISERESKDAMKRLEDEILRLCNEKQMICDNYEATICKLEKKYTDCCSKERELRKEFESLKQSNQQLEEVVGEKETELSTLSNALEETSVKILELRNALEEGEAEKKAKESENNVLTARLAEKESAFVQMATEYEEEKSKRLKVKAELENVQNDREKESERLKTTLDSTTAALETSQSEMRRLKELLHDVEETAKANIENSNEVMDLKKSIGNLENELLDRNKTIKLQQQRLNDMKKTLQRELKMQTVLSDTTNGDSTLMDLASAGSMPDLSSSGTMNAQFKDNHELFHKLNSLDGSDLSFDDINFRYLKHVIFKFMTSREYEAQHLIKAISVLLRFTPDEERLIRDTMEWKKSWFGSKPKFGPGQISKKIPTT